MNPADILKKYITDKYGSIFKFSNAEKFFPHDLEIIFQRKDFFRSFITGVKIYREFGESAEEIFCGDIKVTGGGKNSPPDSSPDTDITDMIDIIDVIAEKFMKLSGDERQKALDYADFIFERGDMPDMQ